MVGGGVRLDKYTAYSQEDLIKEITALKQRKTYGLVWETEKTREQLPEGKLPVLAEVAEKAVAGDGPTNILIEGDNYHALTALQFTHAKAIDVIYIDPPYNTGNGDFRYNDQWVDIEDGYRHSKWLSFMLKRLVIAKNLLVDNGIIFVSIDDNEHARLQLLGDEIFGENNFIGTITWEKRTKAQNTETARHMFQSKTEYILIYKKGADKIKFNLEVTGEKEYTLEDRKGLYRLKLVEEMSAVGMRGRQTMIYPIEKVLPRKGFQWKIGKDQIEKFRAKGDIELIEGKVYLKIRPHDETNQTFLPFWSHFFDKDSYGTSEKGKAELTRILGTPEHEFETVKPVNLIKKLLFHINKKDCVILDFFAGSGTTGHAVLALNKEDGGNRKFILCTNNENNICTDVCYPRVKRVMAGYTTPNKEKVAGLGGALRYFRTEFVDAKNTDKNRKEIVKRSTEIICIKEDAFEKIKSTKEYKLFKNKTYNVGIIFDEDAIEEFITEATKHKGDIHVYIFSLDESVPDYAFKEIKDRVTLCPIPESLLQAYRQAIKHD